MPARPRIDTNHREIRKFLRGPAMQKLLKSEATPIAKRAGPGIEVQVTAGRNRARATIRTATDEARAAQAAHKTLSKALRHR